MSDSQLGLLLPGPDKDQELLTEVLCLSKSLLHAIPAKRRKVHPAEKVQVEAAQFYPLLDLPDTSKTRSSVATVLSIPSIFTIVCDAEAVQGESESAGR